MYPFNTRHTPHARAAHAHTHTHTHTHTATDRRRLCGTARSFPDEYVKQRAGARVLGSVRTLDDDGARRGRGANDVLHALERSGRQARTEVLGELVEQLHVPLLEVAL